MTPDDNPGARWAQWQPRTAADEALVRRRWAIALPVIALVVGVGVATAVFFNR